MTKPLFKVGELELHGGDTADRYFLLGDKKIYLSSPQEAQLKDILRGGKPAAPPPPDTDTCVDTLRGRGYYVRLGKNPRPH